MYQTSNNYRAQGCASRKFSESPSGSQAFYLGCPGLKDGRQINKSVSLLVDYEK